MKFSVTFINGDVITFRNKEEAIRYILQDFSHNVELGVLDIQDEKGNLYNCKWDVSLMKREEQ